MLEVVGSGSVFEEIVSIGQILVSIVLKTNDIVDLNDLDSFDQALVEALQHAAGIVLPVKQHCQARPWTSSDLLNLISARNRARAVGDFSLEQSLSRDIKRQARRDKRDWLEEGLRSQDWHLMKSIRKSDSTNHANLKDASHATVASEDRADTFADHFEKHQWCEQDTPDFPEDLPPCHSPLHVECGPAAMTELQDAVELLKPNKQSGYDGIPGEFWKCICLPGSGTCEWVLSFFDSIWSAKQVPESWHLARIKALYKKRRSRRLRKLSPYIGFELRI